MSNEVVIGTQTLTTTLALYATLTAWSPLVDVYIKGSDDEAVQNSTWEVFAVVGATRTRIASAQYDDLSGKGQRIVKALAGKGTTIELWGKSNLQSSAAPIKAAIVGWDRNTFQDSDTDEDTDAFNYASGAAETLECSLDWHPNVCAFIEAGSAATGSLWTIKAVLEASFEVPVATEAYGNLQASRLTVAAEGGCESWKLYGSAPAAATGAGTAALFGHCDSTAINSLAP